MNSFYYNGDAQLCVEQTVLSDIAKQVGTPCYVYSRAAIEQQWQAMDVAFGDHPHTICYAVKANSNLAVLNLLSRLGCGFDIVSGGELHRVLLAGGDPAKTLFSGVAKSREEIALAINANIHSINIESLAELERVQEVASELAKDVAVALRINPDVDPKTHPFISTGMENAKFGINMDAAFDAYILANQMPNIRVQGIACHIGSQIISTSPFNDAVDRIVDLVKRLKAFGIEIEQLDLGGGLGIDYQGEAPPSPKDYIRTMLDCLKKHEIDLPISVEPGRYIVGNAGVLLTQVEYLKSNTNKNFAIVDAGMNDLLRPSLYQAHHGIINCNNKSTAAAAIYDVVGPVCESADVLGYDRNLKVHTGDLLAVQSAGAYAYTMASNYNSRPRPAEIMVDGDSIHIIRPRENIKDLAKGEAMLP